jgi:hypothetical protein
VNAAAFTDAYRRYCWPTDGLTGVHIAPFQLLATDGAATTPGPTHGTSTWPIGWWPPTRSWWPTPPDGRRHHRRAS